jgi:hypothetical protein
LANKLQQTTNHDAIITEAPREQSRLTFVDTACLVINRMIGKKPVGSLYAACHYLLDVLFFPGNLPGPILLCSKEDWQLTPHDQALAFTAVQELSCEAPEALVVLFYYGSLVLFAP